jgi:hypothetical protein
MVYYLQKSELQNKRYEFSKIHIESDYENEIRK